MKKINCAIFSLIFLMTISCKFADKEDFILTECVNEYFAVVYNCADGIEKVYSDNRIQYKIPKNRIIITNYPRNKGVLDQELHLENNNDLKPLEDFDCLIMNKSQTVISISDFEFGEKSDDNMEIRYKYYTLFYLVGNNGTNNNGFESFSSSLKKYLIENKIKSNDSVIVKKE